MPQIEGRPAEIDIVAEIQRAAEGMTAVELLEAYKAKGYASQEVQRAIRRALDSGRLVLGGKLRLYAHEDVAA